MTPLNDDLQGMQQERFELDPAAHDSSGNHDVDSLGIPASSLFEQALEQTRMAVAISDPHRPDSPIVYVNQAFLELTGYERDECIGRNCRFLQGPDTQASAVEAIRECIEGRQVKVVEILNYRKDGSTFWNALHVGPVYDDAGELTHFYGSQWDVTDTVEKRNRLALQAEVAEELQHRTKNLFAVISSIVSLSARGETDAQVLAEKIRARVQALGSAHAASISEGREGGKASDLHDLVLSILSPYQEDDAERIVLRGPIVRVPRQALTPVGLMLHELATNAVKYGALSQPGGSVTIEWTRKDDRLALTWVEAGGPEVSTPHTAGTGTRMMDGVLRTIGASLNRDWPPGGLTVTLDLGLDPVEPKGAAYRKPL